MKVDIISLLFYRTWKTNLLKFDIISTYWFSDKMNQFKHRCNQPDVDKSCLFKSMTQKLFLDDYLLKMWAFWIFMLYVWSISIQHLTWLSLWLRYHFRLQNFIDLYLHVIYYVIFMCFICIFFINLSWIFEKRQLSF